MFMSVIKIKKSRLLAVIWIVAIAFAVAALIFTAGSDFAPVKDYATCDEVGEYSLSAKSRYEQAEFFEQFGISVSVESAVSDEVIIPDKFNGIYENYNALQKRIGLDLEPYRGKTAERIRFAVDDGTNRQAVILVYKNTVIGAHVTSGKYGDENQPLV